MILIAAWHSWNSITGQISQNLSILGLSVEIPVLSITKHSISLKSNIFMIFA